MKINFDRATKRKYSIETVAPNRFYLTFAERNSRGEQITIGFTACKTHPESRADLAAAWHRAGSTPAPLASYWSIETYATDEEGFCHGYYNPQHKLGGDAKAPARLINFDFMLPATEQSAAKILREVERRAFRTYQRI